MRLDPASDGFKWTEENPLDCNLLVLDETSMVDVLIMAATLKAVRSGSAVILVGDLILTLTDALTINASPSPRLAGSPNCAKP